jgi:CDP-diacylglycerol--serine O-phosphatidyltransferase
MVSRIPTFSGKGIGRVSREAVLPLLAAVTIIVAMLVTYTWEMLTLVSAIYIALIPVSALAYLRQKKAWEQRMAKSEPGSPAAAAGGAEHDTLADIDPT